MLEIGPVTLGYDGKPVLQFDGITLAQGAQCLITGASGSGKTSLLYAIAGLISVMRGRIAINGTDITALSESARDRFRGQHIGMVFQTLHLVKSLSVWRNLQLASYVAHLPPQDARARAVLHQLDIFHAKDALPQQLSQGQQQRVAIARAVLHQPSLILADEPTSSLDDASCAAVVALLKQVARESHATLLVSTHDSRVRAHFSQIIAMGDVA
jgi:ABC-type lipoprotein export system ATPase subunit